MRGAVKQNSKFRLKIIFITTSIRKDLVLAIILIPIWWVLGVKFFIFHIIILFLLIKLFVIKWKKSEAIYIPYQNLILLIFIILYISSIIINNREIPLSRILASLYNLSFWIMGMFIIVIIHNTIQREHILSIFRTFRDFGLICSIVVLNSLFLWIVGIQKLKIKSILSGILPAEFMVSEAPLIGASLSPSILGRHWIFGKMVPRPYGFNVYPTALGATMLFLIVATFAYYKIKNKKNWKVARVILFLELVALFSSLTRIAIFGLFLAWIIVYTVSNIKKLSFTLVLQFILIIFIIFLIVFPLNIITAPISKFRESSTRVRLSLYKISLSQAAERPILGHGYKPRPAKMPIPIGSHSTYVGTIYKTGFLGFFIFFLFWISVIRKWWTQRNLLRDDNFLKHLWYYSGIILIGGLIWMFTEDMDATPIVAFIYFIIVGLILSLNKLKNSKATE